MRPLSLTNPPFLALKAALASGVAIAGVRATHNPDLVTASFVAVLCCSPAVLMGIGVSAVQLGGSAIGGVVGALAVILDVPLQLGVPLAVGLSIFIVHALGYGKGQVAAAFTALFLQIVTFGSAVQTLSYRLQAVAIAGASATLVNLLVSSLFYESLFQKRMLKVHRHLEQLWPIAVEKGPQVFEPLFSVLNQLESELRGALAEARWRKSTRVASRLEDIHAELDWLRDYAHLLVDLEFCVVESDLGALRDLLGQLAKGVRPTSHALTGDAAITADRILRHLEKRPEPPLEQPH